MFLADSSVWIDFFNGAATPQADFLARRIESGEAIIGDLILAEVLQGIDSDRQFGRVRRLMSALGQLDIAGPAIAIEAARNFRRLRALGVTVRKTIDTLIATRCIVDGLPLLWSDRDFEPFRVHLGLVDAMDMA